MVVIVTENVPNRLRGRIAVWFVEVRAGVYIGNMSKEMRQYIWSIVETNLCTGNAVMSWSTNSESGYDFVTAGANRRHPVDIDGVRLVALLPEKNKNDNKSEANT